MYECCSCGRKFQEPKAAYTETLEGLTVTSDSEDFNSFVWAHAEHSWTYCPHCGSDDIFDHDE